jgi:hypothetical protein
MIYMAIHRQRGRIARRLQAFTPTERLLPSSLLNFLAGLLAGAGINLLTAVATGPTDVSSHDVGMDAVFWVVAAAFSASAAHVVEGAVRKAAAIERTVSSALGEEEQLAILRNEAGKVALTFWSLVLLTAFFVAVAVAFIPQVTQATGP